MTKEEIRKFLANTKVYVAGKSKEIQEKLFSLGYCWYINESTEVKHEKDPFIFIYKTHSISSTNDMLIFTRSEYREITVEEILSLKLTEPKYRPFKDINECWNKMKKHEPFGWLKRKDTNAYCCISSIFNIESGFSDDYIYNYKYLYDNYTFADETPFGIKEN